MDSKSSSRGYTINYTHNPKGTVPTWVDGYCVMKSLIVKSERSGNPIKIKALSRELGNTGWTVHTCVSIESYMEDLITIIFNLTNRMILLMIQWHKLVLNADQIMKMTT